MDKSLEVDTDEYFDWWANFLLQNCGEMNALQSCDELLAATPISFKIERDRLVKIRDSIIKKVQKRLN